MPVYRIRPPRPLNSRIKMPKQKKDEGKIKKGKAVPAVPLEQDAKKVTKGSGK